jgi:putative heme-binding domain-containing protein
MPKDWPAAFEKILAENNPGQRNLALAVAVTFGDPKALTLLRKTLTDSATKLPDRQAALAALLDARDKELAPILHALVADPALRAAAVRGLAAYDDPKTPGVILAAYPAMTPAEKRDALGTLAARAGYGKELLNAVAAKALPATDIPAETVRQLRNLQDAALDRQIADMWGVVRDTPADRARLITEWRRRFANPQAEDLPLGRAVFARVCQQCHTLYGVGGKVGPDITGSNRGDLAYVLENIFDPSAVIPKEYAATKLDLEDGRVVTGIVKEETKQTLTVVTANETLTIPAVDVARCR